MKTKFLLALMFLSISAFGQQNPIQIGANGITQTLTAGGLVTTGQIVKINSAGQVVPMAVTDTSGAIGIAATSQTSAGNGVQVSIGGTTLVQIDSGGCAAGNFVSISATAAGTGHCSATSGSSQIGFALSISSPGSNFWNVALSLGGGGGGGGSPAAGTTIYAWDPKYNLKATAKWVCDATFTLNSPTVTTPSTDRPFLATDSFAIVVGGAALCGGNAQQNIATLTPANATATFVSAHTITLSGNALATCTPTVSQGGCALFWGPDDTAALQSAFNDAANNCGTMVMPAGGIIVNALVNNTASLCPVTDLGDDKLSAVTIMGQGPFSTMLLFTPNVSFTSPMFSWGNTTFLQRTNMHDFGVASFTAATAVMAGQTGFKTGFNSEFYNLWFLDFFTSNANQFFALVCNGVTNAVTNCHNLLMINSGENAIVTNSQDVNIYSCWLQGSSALIGGTIGGPPGTLVTRDNRFTISGTLGAAGVSSGTFIWHSYGDRFNSSGTSLPGININGNSGTVVDFHDVSITGSQTTGPSLSIAAGNTVTIDGDNNVISASTGTANAITNAGTLILRNTTVSSTGGTGLSNSGTVTFKEGNSISNSITNTGTFNGQQGQGSYQGSCTGVVTSATTVGLYGLGQQTATTCTNTTVSSGVVMSKAGSVYALYCTATAGNQATDACTVVKNGAAQTMTCSLNGVATCTDGTAAHVVSFVQGDILSIEAIAGTATTLANVKGTLVTN